MTKKPIPQIKFNLGSIMEQRNISVDELAFQCRAAGRPLTRTALYNLRNEPKAVRMESISVLCAALGISPADLFTQAK